MEQRRRKLPLMLIASVIATAAIAIGAWLVVNGMTNEQAAVPYNGHGGTFKNTLADIDTPDPSIVYQDGYYYMTFTHNGTDIMVMKSRTLDFHQAERKVVWYPPVGTMYSANLWAPEIQYLQGKWYIYFAADDGDNANHRMYVLEADTDDPLGSYTFKGQVADDTNKWAIDGLVLELDGRLYFIWSGWEGDVNIAQNTYIAPMSNPWTISGPRVLLSEPEYEWERAGGPPYINEGQAILKKDGRVFLAYSGAGSWTPFYSIGMLMLEAGADPLVPDHWHKFEHPFMQMDQEAGVFGPGHNTFVSSPDGTEHWIVYHATSGLHDGWNNRKARAQRIEWDDQGLPVLGKPLSLDTAIEVPSGTGVFYAEHATATADGALEFDLIPSSVETKAPLIIHYTSAAGTNGRVDIDVNGERETVAELPAAESGRTGYAYASVPLQDGQNTIGLSAITEGVTIEAIEIPRFEAEAGRTAGSSEAFENPFASGRGTARVGANEQASVLFGNVRVPREGDYELIFAIANASDESVEMDVVVNGSARERIEAAPTGRNQFTPVHLTVHMHGGSNTIVLEQASGGIEVDYLDVVKAQIHPTASASGEGDSSASRLRLEYWTPFSGGDNQFMTNMVDMFNQEQSEIQVVQVNSRLDDYYSRLRTAILSGNAPDVAVIHTTNLPQFVQNGYIENLSEPAEDVGIDWQVFNPNILESIVYDGEAFAVPLDTHALVMFYNKRYLDMAGVLDEEGKPIVEAGTQGFKQFLQAIQNAVPADVAPMAQPSTRIDSVWLWWSLYNQMEEGGQFYDENGAMAVFHNPEALEALDFVHELYESELIPPNINDAFKQFYDGKAAILITGMWGTGAFEANADLDFGAVKVPTLYDHPAVWGDSHTLAIPTHLDMTDEKRRAVLTFAKWLVDHGEMWAEAGHVPSKTDVLHREAFLRLQFRRDYADTADHVAYWPRHDMQWTFIESMIQQFERMIYGEITPEEALQTAQAAINQELAK